MFIVPMTRHMSPLSRSMDRLFDERLFDHLLAPCTNDGAAVTPARTPALDVTETETGYAVQLDMPGVAKEDVKITIDGKRVTISAATRSSTERKDGERLIYSERQSASYARSFTLPVELNEADSGARLEHGVLHLQLAKRSAARTAQLTVN